MALEWLTDAFTGRPAQQAATQTRNYLSGVQNAGTGAINTGLQSGLTALDSARTGGINAINAGSTDALGYLDQARGAYLPLQNLGSKYGGATSLALGALGVGTPEQMAQARAAFTAGPGYDWQLGQGIDAITRQRNAMGMGASGNAQHDAIKYASGLAGQEYGNWLDRLLGFTQPELAATSGAATGQAGIGRDQANVASERGRMLADVMGRWGVGAAGLHSGAAGQQVGLSTGLASPYANTYGQEAAAQQQGSQNVWNATLGGAGLLTGLYGQQQGANALLANRGGNTGAMAPTTGPGYRWPT